MKRNEVMTGHEVMGRARRWYHMLRDFRSIFTLGFVALGVALLGDPLRDEDSCADTDRNRKQKQLAKTQR
jgi:hypothetical protein